MQTSGRTGFVGLAGFGGPATPPQRKQGLARFCKHRAPHKIRAARAAEPAFALTPRPLRGLPSPATCRDQDGSVLEITNAVIAHALKQRTKDDVTG